MRRDEFKSDDRQEFEYITRMAEVGHLGVVVADGYPRVVPVNFAVDGTTVYFHGATEGEKFLALESSPKVTFSIELPLSIIPSYWIGRENAGGATHYYKSILMRGTGQVVTDVTDKAHGLQLLMEKYQPEGGYRRVTAADPFYLDIVRNTAVFRVDPVQIDIKIKLPFNKPEEFRRSLIERLTARAQGPDLATAAALRKSLGS
jgi:nitroimidazol reductase NimA-like FMN-containing flavoprotein (pyridoxamine 5'-phosphate oxidase superfamily)